MKFGVFVSLDNSVTLLLCGLCMLKRGERETERNGEIM